MSDERPWDDYAAPAAPAAAGPWTDYSAPAAGPWADYAPAPAEAPAPPSALRRLPDIGATALKGAIAVPEAALGIADLVTGGRAGQLAEQVGFRPKEAKSIIDDWYSPQQKAANQAVQQAQGFWPTVGAALSNPSTIAHGALESAPLMVGGAGVARGLVQALPKLGGAAAAGIGEGVVGAGLAAEQIRQQTADGLLTPTQTALATGIGGLTAGLGVAGGKLAQRLGITDIDTALVGQAAPPAGQAVAQAAAKGRLRRIGEGALVEGVFEELPQSVQEQAGQNLALDRPIGEGVAEAGAMGMLVGGAMGGGFNALAPSPPQTPDAAPGDDIRALQTPDTGPLTRTVNLGLEGEAQTADAGVTADAPIASALHGITPRADGEKPNPAHAPIDDKTANRVNAGVDAGVNAGDAGLNAGVNAGVPHPIPADARQTNAGVDAGVNAGLRQTTPALPTRLPRPGVAIPGARDPELALDRLHEQAARDLKDLRQWDNAPDRTPVQPGDILDGQAPFQSKLTALRARAKLDQAATVAPVPVTGGYALRALPAVAEGAEGSRDEPRPDGRPAGRPAGLPGHDGAGRGAEPGGMPPAVDAPPDANGGRGLAVAAAAERRDEPARPVADDGRRAGAITAPLPETTDADLAPAATVQPLPTGARSAAPLGLAGAAAPEPTAPGGAAEPTAAPDPGLSQQRAPEIVEQPSADPQRPSGARWSGDRGAMPGEPFAFLDGEPDSARAAMREVHTPGRGVHYEVHADGGQLLASGSTADEAARLAEQVLDQPAADAPASAIDSAAHSAATSPHNDLREPSDAEKEHGNYAKGHLRLDGMQVSIENPKGSVRSSKADAAEPWQVTMPAHYGYIRGTVGADTTDAKKPEQVDLTIGDAGENHRYWVINQNHPDGQFDEHKVVTGVASADEAVALYKASFANNFGDQVFASVSGELSPDALKAALPGMRQPVPVTGGEASFQVGQRVRTRDGGLAVVEQLNVDGTLANVMIVDNESGSGFGSQIPVKELDPQAWTDQNLADHMAERRPKPPQPGDVLAKNGKPFNHHYSAMRAFRAMSLPDRLAHESALTTQGWVLRKLAVPRKNFGGPWSADRDDADADGTVAPNGPEQTPQTLETPTPPAAAEDHGAWWTRATATERGAALLDAGWTGTPGKLSLNGQTVAAKPWAELRENQRRRIAAARDKRSAPVPAVPDEENGAIGFVRSAPETAPGAAEVPDSAVKAPPVKVNKVAEGKAAKEARDAAANAETAAPVAGDKVMVQGGRHNGTVRTLLGPDGQGGFKVSDSTSGSVNVLHVKAMPDTPPGTDKTDKSPAPDTVPARRDWKKATPDEIGAEIDRLSAVSDAAHREQQALPFHGEERARAIAKMDDADRQARELQKLLPDDETSAADEPEANDEPFVPPANWRESMFYARTYARTLGIEPAGLELPALLKAIDKQVPPAPKVNKVAEGKAKKDIDSVLRTTRRFASGLSRTGDLGHATIAGGGMALGGVGVEVGELSANGIDTLANGVINLNTAVFVDSGAYSAFVRGLKLREFQPMDFDAILERYDDILVQIQDANPAERTDYVRPLFVMPDVVGDQAASLALVTRYKDFISAYATTNVMRPIVPIQKGELSMAQAYAQVVATLGTDQFIVGIPSNKKAVTPDELTEFLRAAHPKAIHILGGVADSRLRPRLQSVVDAGLAGQLEVSADASPIRSRIIQAVDAGATRGDAISAHLYNPDDPALTTPDPRDVVAPAAKDENPPHDAAAQTAAPALDPALAGAATPAAPIRGARQPRRGAGRPDDPGVRGQGSLFDGGDGPSGNDGNAGRDAGAPDQPAGGVAPGARRLPAHPDHRPGPGGLTRTGSWLETAERNAELIELALKIETEQRAATPDEQARLAKYVGFGASAIRNPLFPVPNPYQRQQDPKRLIWPQLVHEARWRAIAERLDALPRAWQESVLQSTQYAHYTSEGIVRSIWSALQRIGFTGGKVLEPGSGIGNFSMLMPDAVHRTSQFTGIEFDGPTALIARLLSPEQHMLHDDFIKRRLPKDFYDLAVGNPPFAQTVILGDPDYLKHRFALHDFFFAKAMDRVRPGGLLAFVTSKGTMDKLNDKARQYLAERADLLGAIRLPSTAFEANAGTSVITDVIFLRKRLPGETAGGAAWTGLGEVTTPDGPVLVNEYFAANPHMVLGQQRISGNTDDMGRRINSNGFGGEKYTVVSYDRTPAELDAKFAAAIEQLPQNAYASLSASAEQVKRETAKIDYDPLTRREGVVYVDQAGALMRVESGVGRELAAGVKLSAKDQAWFKGYVGVRDLVKQAQAVQIANGDWQAALKALNRAYDAFVKVHGPFRAYRTQTRKGTDEDGNPTEVESRIFTNTRLLREDYDRSIVTALEHIDADGQIGKSKFLTMRTVGAPVVRDVKTIGDALAVSLDTLGKLSLADVASRLNISRDDAIEALGTQVYQTPAGEWQLADEYLSGDVVAKLAEATDAARLDPRLVRNVDALKEAQPEKLGPSQIGARLGASWIAANHINDFAKEIGAGTVTFSPTTESWQVAGGNERSARRAGAEYGTADRSVSELLETALNSRTPEVKYGSSAGKELAGKTNAAATTAAVEMMARIKTHFKSWVWTDSGRAAELVETYNTTFNNIAPRKFDGSHLTLPGVSTLYKLHPHQLRAIWRQIVTGNTYLAHAVGAGKTIEMIAGGMEQKRLGLISKPLYAVPNQMLEQFAAEFLELYPLANIMVADDENFSAERRKAFIAAATLNKPDAIIITHSAFERIGVKEESIAPIRAQILGQLQDDLDDAAKDNNARVRRSQLEAQIEAVKQRFDSIVGSGKKDSTFKFEDMGVDFIYADEAHTFRKLDFPTNQKVKGIDPNGSRRTLDMFVKTRYLESQRPGRSFTFASGTPVTNTMGELYTLMRFFIDAQMTREGIATFDGWARQFGEVAAFLESNAAGRYETVTRFAKFENVPELMSRVRQFMDVLRSDQLGAVVKRPDVEGGKPDLIVVPMLPALRSYMDNVLAPRLEVSKAWKPSADQPANPDPVIAIISDGRFAALDPRFIGAKVGDNAPTKLNRMADGVIAEYKATTTNPYTDKDGKAQPPGGTQIVFYNLGFGESARVNRGFDSRAALTRRLVAGGIKREHIAWFDDADTDAKKGAVFRAMRSGQVRVLIGSAKKMGTGVNVQDRLTALHYFDAPWYPADVEQPHGRIIRQGNQNDSVRIFWYATKGTYDSTMWQMVARKQRFIDQAFSGDKNLRSMEDLGEASQYEQAAAVASGDPRAIQLAGLRQDVERLERLQAAHANEQINARRALNDAHWSVTHYRTEIARAGKAFKAIGERHVVFSSGQAGGQTFERMTEFGDALKAAFNQQTQAPPTPKWHVIGTLPGISVEMRALFDEKGEPVGAYNVAAMIGGSTYPVLASNAVLGADTDAIGLVRKVVNQANAISRELDDAKRGLERNEVDVVRLNKKVGAPFEHQQEMLEKHAELRQLELDLAAEGTQTAGPRVMLDAEGLGWKVTKGPYNRNRVLWVTVERLNDAGETVTQEVRYDSLQDQDAPDTPAGQSAKDEDIDELLQAHGEPVTSRMDAERRFNAGDRLFVMHDQAETPREIHGVTELDGYTADQMLALPAGGNLSVHETLPTAYNSDDGYPDPTASRDFPADARRGAPGDPVPGRTIRALGISRDLHVVGATHLVGRTARSAAEVAELAQVYRNPRYEVFRVLFTRGDEIVHASGVTLRLPGQTPVFPKGMNEDQGVAWLTQQMAGSGADGYYLLHNHPSGNPQPSTADEVVTRLLAQRVPGMKAHVVINSGKFATITPAADEFGEVATQVHDLPHTKGPDTLLTPAVPSAFLGKLLSNPAAVAATAKQVQVAPGMVTLIGQGSGGVRAIIEVPAAQLRRPTTAQALVRRYARMSGSSQMFVYGARGDFNPDVTAALMRDRYVLDVVYSDGGASESQTGATTERPGMVMGLKANGGGTLVKEPDGPNGLATLRDTLRELTTRRGLTERLHDLFKSQQAFNGWWHKTVGTQYHKAQVNPEFKRVYDAAQDYMHDTNAFANDSAGYAPDVLPQLNGLRDVLRPISLSPTDRRALAAPLFEGTLTDRREYEPAELASRFQLSPQQVKLYQQARAAIARSLDTLVASDVARFLGDDIPRPIKQMISAGDLGRFKGLVMSTLQQQREAADNDLKALRKVHRDAQAALSARQLAASKARKPGMALAHEARDEDERATLNASQAAALASAEAERDRWAHVLTVVTAKYTKVDQLKAEGYTPLMRFGRYSVYVTREDAGGETEQVYFGLYETEREANRAARGFRGEAGVTVTQGVLPQEAHKLFAGLDPETVALFADLAGIEHTDAMQAYLKLALGNRSALKRLIQRKGVAGFSEDPARVLASFVASNARAASGNMHLGDIDTAIGDMEQRKVDGSTIDEAMKLRDYVKTPGEEAQVLRSLLFTFYLGGSVASALVNLTQPFTMTLPYLAQYGGAVKAGVRLAAAVKQALHPVGGALGRAIAQAEKEGIVSPQEIHQLQAEASRSVGNNPLVRKGLFVWGSLFSLAEQFNRRSSFIAAWHTAHEEGIADPYTFASNAVEATQGVYNKANRPNWARGAVGATVFTFKQFTISYVEFLKRLPPKERTLALAVLFLMAGLGGLPGADDLDDLIDSLAQSLGSDFNSKLVRTRLLTQALGSGGADFVLHGLSAAPGFPFDVSARLSVGNLIPGTGLLLQSATDKTRDVLEVAGVAGSFAQDMLKVGGGDVQKAMPLALRNLDQAIEMYRTGQYKDDRDRNVRAVDTSDAVFKGIGFQPANVAHDSRLLRMAQQQVALAKVTEAKIAAQWAQGVNERDPAQVKAAVTEMMRWNRDNPASRIAITPAQIQRRVRDLNLSREDRFLKTTPKEMRGTVLPGGLP